MLSPSPARKGVVQYVAAESGKATFAVDGVVSSHHEQYGNWPAAGAAVAGAG